MNGQESEQIRLLREILKWIQFAGMKEVKNTLIAILDSEQKKLVYQLSDGEKGSVEIAEVAGVSDWTVRNYWKTWAKTGIVESLKAGRGDRYKHSFNLEDIGISMPKPSTTRTEKQNSTKQSLLTLGEESQSGAEM